MSGDLYFKIDDADGSNLYGCTTKGAWAPQGSFQIKSSDTVVAEKNTFNFESGTGLVTILQDDGSQVNVALALDTAVVQTQGGEQAGAALLCASSSSTGRSFQCSLTPTLWAYTIGMVLRWKPEVNGSGGAMTLNVDQLGARAVKMPDGATDPSSSDIVGGRLYLIWYDGSAFRLMNRDTLNWASLTGVPATFTPTHHAASHQNGGADEIAVTTAGPNAIPKATSAGTLAKEWIDFSGYQATTDKGVANGYAGLDANAAVPLSNLPTVVLRADRPNDQADRVTPSAPAAGTTRTYTKGGRLCALGSSGSETCTGSSVGGSPGGSSGQIQYNNSGNFGGLPTSGTGTTVTTTTGSPTAGAYTAFDSSGNLLSAPPMVNNDYGMWSPVGWPPQLAATTAPGVTPLVYHAALPYTATLNKVVFSIGTALGTSCTGGTCGVLWGVYSAGCGTQLARSTVFTSGSATGPTTASLTAPVTLTPGVYCIMLATDSTALTVSDATATYGLTNAVNKNRVRVGACQNPATGNGANLSLPTTCGTITAGGNHWYWSVWE